jgi:hypothetical protein
MSERRSGAKLKDHAATALGMAALSGFVVVGACAAAAISLWEVSGELRPLHIGARKDRRLMPTVRRVVALELAQPEPDPRSLNQKCQLEHRSA